MRAVPIPANAPEKQQVQAIREALAQLHRLAGPNWFESWTERPKAPAAANNNASAHAQFGVLGRRVPGTEMEVDSTHPFPLLDRAHAVEATWLSSLPPDLRAELIASISPHRYGAPEREEKALPALPLRERVKLSTLGLRRRHYQISYRRRHDLAPSYPRAPYARAASYVERKTGTEKSLFDVVDFAPLGDAICRDRTQGKKQKRPTLRVGLRAGELPNYPHIRIWSWPSIPPWQGDWIDSALDLVSCAKLRMLEWAELQYTESADFPDPALPTATTRTWGYQSGRAHPAELLADIRGKVQADHGQALPNWADDAELWGWVLRKCSFADGASGQIAHQSMRRLLENPQRLAQRIRSDGDRMSSRLTRYRDSVDQAPSAKKLFWAMSARILRKLEDPAAEPEKSSIVSAPYKQVQKPAEPEPETDWTFRAVKVNGKWVRTEEPRAHMPTRPPRPDWDPVATTRWLGRKSWQRTKHDPWHWDDGDLARHFCRFVNEQNCPSAGCQTFVRPQFERSFFGRKHVESEDT